MTNMEISELAANVAQVFDEELRARETLAKQARTEWRKAAAQGKALLGYARELNRHEQAYAVTDSLARRVIALFETEIGAEYCWEHTPGGWTCPICAAGQEQV